MTITHHRGRDYKHVLCPHCGTEYDVELTGCAWYEFTCDYCGQTVHGVLEEGEY